MPLGRRRLRPSLAAGAGRLAAACSSPDPRYYTVVARTGPTLPSGPRIVLLKDIGLASYLDRREIVRSSEGYKLDIMSNDWWGEPLGGMLGRVLVVELSQRLPGSTVYAESGAITADANAIVGVNIQRLDADKAGKLILLAQVAVDFNRPVARRRAISRSPGRCRRRTSRAWWRRSATPSASSPTASPRCCSHDRRGPGPVTRAAASRVSRLRPVPDRAGAGAPTCAPTACAAAPCCGSTRADPMNHHLALTFAGAGAVRRRLARHADEGVDRRHRARDDARFRADRAGQSRPVAAGARRRLHHGARARRQVRRHALRAARAARCGACRPTCAGCSWSPAGSAPGPCSKCCCSACSWPTPSSAIW